MTDNKVYCFSCIFFPSDCPSSRFVDQGFDNWARAIGDSQKGLDGHALSTHHIISMQKWTDFKLANSTGTIADKVNPSRPANVENNRQYFTNLVQYIRFFCLQELPFRSNTDHDAESANKGNFRELLELAFELHPEFHSQRQNIRHQVYGNRDYLSKTVFNEFIQIMANEVRLMIKNEVKENKFFSIIIDECKDASNFEQLSVCLRYSVGSKPTERFYCLNRLGDGDFSANAIVKQLQPIIKDLMDQECFIIGIAADGASVMSGHVAGVQALLKKRYPWLIYVHCMAHRLSLVVVKSIKVTCKDVIDILDKLHTIFSSAKSNDKFIQVQQDKDLTPLSVPARSDTRWASLFQVLDIVCRRYDAILHTLAERASDDDDAAVTCAGLQHKLATGTMLMRVVVLKHVFGAVHSLSETLQSQLLEWSSAAHEIKLLKQSLDLMKNATYIQNILDEAREIGNKSSIELNKTYASYSLRSYMSDKEIDEKEYMTEFVQKCCNIVQVELENRFSPSNMDILRGMDSLNAGSKHYLNESLMKKLVEHYGADNIQVSETLLSFDV